MKRLHAALTLRHPEETSPAVGPLTVQSTCGFCAHLRTSLAAYLSRCTDTYSTDFSLCEALPSQARYTVGAHTNICSGICRPGTQMHVHEKRLLYPGNKDRSCRSRNFCIDASPHERLAANHMANARYRGTRPDISVYSPISSNMCTCACHRYADIH